MLKKCEWCGNEFITDSKIKKYCSPECRNSKHRQTSREWRKKHKNNPPKPKNPKRVIDLTPICGEKSCFECPYDDCRKN